MNAKVDRSEIDTLANFVCPDYTRLQVGRRRYDVAQYD